MRQKIQLDPRDITEEYVDRFWARTIQNAGCMEWQGALSHGYGRVRINGNIALAHRVAYVIARGPIPEGLVLDHLCRNPACVNPDHLEAVTYRENGMRGVNPTFALVRSGACKSGHPRQQFGIRSNNGDGEQRWRCRACESARDQRRAADPVERAKKRERMRRLREKRRDATAPFK